MKLATMINFDVIEKINTGFKFRDPSSNEFSWSFVIHNFFRIPFFSKKYHKINKTVNYSLGRCEDYLRKLQLD